MNDTPVRQIDLQVAAKQAMLENGFEPEFSPQVQRQLEELKAHPPQFEPSTNIRDLRNLLWSSESLDVHIALYCRLGKWCSHCHVAGRLDRQREERRSERCDSVLVLV